MLIKFGFSALRQNSRVRTQKSELGRLFFPSSPRSLLAGSWLLACGFLFSTIDCLLFPATARAEQAVLGVVKSEENAAQWTEITSRLRLAGVAYCTIALPDVQSAADLGDRAVLFLPNVQAIAPTQAIALEDWMSHGGRIIASGPTGNMSQPGVRQLLGSLLGAYWGFPLAAPANLQPLRTNAQNWLRQAGKSGQISGGVVIPTGINSKPVAIWQSKENQAAVVTTDRTTVLGWFWGVNTVASQEFDSAWLRAALSQYIQLPATATATEPAKNCNGIETADVAQSSSNTDAHQQTISSNPPTQQPGYVAQRSSNTDAHQQTISSTPPSQLSPQAPKPVATADEPIERIVPPGLKIAPNSKEPIVGVQASALKQELDKLIGRFESTQLAARVGGGDKEMAKRGDGERTVASLNVPRQEAGAAASSQLNPQFSTDSPADAIAQAKEIAKTLPQLIAQRNYTGARQQWLKAQQLLWQQYPVDRNLAQPEIRAMWLDRGTIVRAGSEKQLAKIFDRLAAAGINTVFFETVNAGYPIYPSQVAPQLNPLVKGWDPLASGVKLAHDRGMELHAWVWTFAAGNRRHNTLINLPADYPGPVITAHPDWASYDNRGSLFPPGQGKPFLDPAHPAARQYLLNLFEEIVSRYQVDGLQLDYIRYPFQDPGADRTYGYGVAARQQFRELTGVDPTTIKPSDRNLWQKWTDFRTNQIDSFVAQASQRLRQKRPNLIMSVAVFPLSEHDRIHKLQQHWEVWANRGDIDLIVPMTYAQDTYRFQRLAQPWITSNKLGSALILPGIRLLNLPTLEAVDQIQLVRDLPVSGYSLFAAENLSDELQKIFHSTQSSNSLALVPYRHPFQTAAVRYNALQQEWNFLLSNNQLWLRGSTLSAFNTGAKDLESSLKQLSKQPSPSNLTAARTALSKFQSQFQIWMRSQYLENPYQVQVWQNRLATVERLLNYGDRVVFKRESPPVAERK